jgi:hypothetical protein
MVPEHLEVFTLARCQWLMLVILATQEDCSLNPAQANSLPDPILKKIVHKKWAGGVVQGVGPEFKPWYQ